MSVFQHVKEESQAARRDVFEIGTIEYYVVTLTIVKRTQVFSACELAAVSSLPSKYITNSLSSTLKVVFIFICY